MLVALVYFAYLTAMAVAAGVPATAGSRRTLTLSLLTFASIWIVGMPHVMPLVYLLMGYWLPSLLVCTARTGLECRLLQFDRVLFGPTGLESFARRAPRVIVEYFELTYLCCYAVVPVGFACLVLAGHREDVHLFWSTVLLASFACYGLLPWLPTRAPRALEDGPHGRSVVRRLNHYVLDRASVQWNTFPSGHTAASVATALAVGSHLPLAGVVLGVIAASIAIGSVVGRYHYAADAIFGALVAVVAFLTASAWHAP